MSLVRFFSILERQLPVRRHLSAWQAELGVELTRVIEMHGIFQRVPMQEGQSFPCGGTHEEGCPRRIRMTGEDSLVAVCGRGDGCDAVYLQHHEAEWLQVTRETLSTSLARLLDAGRPETAEKQLPLFPVGLRHLPPLRLNFMFFWPSNPLVDAQVIANTCNRSEKIDERLVLIVPNRQSLHSSLKQLIADRDIPCLLLDEVMDLDGGSLQIHLGRFLFHNKLRPYNLEALLWPDYWLVLASYKGQYYLGGKLLDLTSGTKPTAFLEILAKNANVVVSRRQVVETVWKDDMPAKGKAKKPAIMRYDAQLASTLRFLRAAMEKVGSAEPNLVGAPEDLLETITSEDQEKRGFILRIPPTRVVWLRESDLAT